MLQAPMFECLSLDPFSSFDDGGSPAEVGIGGCDVAEAIVVAAMVVMIDEGIDLVFEVTRQVIVLQQDAIFQRLVPALDLALGLRVMRGAADMGHAALLEPIRQIAGDVGRTIVAEQSWLMDDISAVAT